MKGGKREGAGRKRGVGNKLTREVRAAVAAGGETPKEYMLRIMRDPTVEHSRRDEMAKAVAPYTDPKLTAIEHSGNADKPVQHKVTIEFVRANE